MKIVKVWSEARGCWIDVSVERDHDRAYDKAKELESRIGGDVRVMIQDGDNPNSENWVNR